MKKFILKWGKGSVCEIRIIYKTLAIEAENIDDINPLEILPEYIKRKVPYVRKILDIGANKGLDLRPFRGFLE